jgi:hypothetical protein
MHDSSLASRVREHYIFPTHHKIARLERKRRACANPGEAKIRQPGRRSARVIGRYIDALDLACVAAICNCHADTFSVMALEVRHSDRLSAALHLTHEDHIASTMQSKKFILEDIDGSFLRL